MLDPDLQNEHDFIIIICSLCFTGRCEQSMGNQWFLSCILWHGTAAFDKHRICSDQTLFMVSVDIYIYIYIYCIFYRKVQNQLFSSILIFNFIFCLFRFQDQWIFIELTDFLEMLYYYINCQYVLKFKTDAHFSIAFEILYWSVWCLNYDKEIIF